MKKHTLITFLMLSLCVAMLQLKDASAAAWGDWAVISAPKGDGFYRVGAEIAPGKWHSTGNSDNCFYDISPSRSNRNDVHYGVAGGVVTIDKDDSFAELKRCGQWKYIEYTNLSPRSDMTALKGDGAYIVGIEISTGPWRVVGDPADCEHRRLNANMEYTEDIIDSTDIGNDSGFVSIIDKDYQVYFEGDCVWEYAGTAQPSSSSGSSGDCVIPQSGPWPPCATGGGGAPATQPQPSAGAVDCVIPESGPWPPCATGSGNNGTVDSIAPANPSQVTGFVTQITDGDTFVINIGGGLYTVRLIGVDAPEKGDTCANEATQRLSNLLLHRTVRLEKDVSETDQYSRLLRYVYVGNNFVNRDLVWNGVAVSKAFPPDTAKQSELDSAMRDATANQRGCINNRPTATPTSPPPQPTSPPPSPSRCCRRCSVGKPCGDSCISRDKQCHKPPGCACYASSITDNFLTATQTNPFIPLDACPLESEDTAVVFRFLE